MMNRFRLRGTRHNRNFVDIDPSANSNEPPIAGLASIHIYNHSFGYAVTWYLLALGTLLAAGILVRYERQLGH